MRCKSPSAWQGISTARGWPQVYASTAEAASQNSALRRDTDKSRFALISLSNPLEYRSRARSHASRDQEVHP